MTPVKNSWVSENSSSALENFRFRSISDRTSQQIFFQKFFQRQKLRQIKWLISFQGESLGVFEVRSCYGRQKSILEHRGSLLPDGTVNVKLSYVPELLSEYNAISTQTKK